MLNSQKNSQQSINGDELNKKKADKNNLSLRIISGICLGLVTIFSIFFGSYFYTSLIFVIFIISIYEGVSIITHSQYLRGLTVQHPQHYVDKLIVRQIIFVSIFSLVPCLSLLYLRFADGQNGFYLTLWLFCSIWSFDTFAFFSGKLIGGPKLLPKISPKKTWSGFIFGIFLSLITSLILHKAFNFSTNIIVFILISIIIPVLSQIGDLIESKFKRYHQVKDSGKIIPGHGGVLDRMDGFLLTAPFLSIIHILWSVVVFAFGVDKFI
jgi:phosphatidate cytidylyltransferase